MEYRFVDRLLTCSDCGGEFIFTAGEQLFFADKQFKNDPKRCKPCKSRRAGLAGKPASGPVAAGISRTETRTECSECGIETTVPFKPTQGRPVLCRQCFQVKLKAAPAAPVAAAAPAPAVLTGDATAAALTDLSANTYGAILAPEAAVLASNSIVNASANSSVATAADLASITADSAAPVPVNLVNVLAQPDADVSAELIAAAAEAPKA